MTPPWTTSPFGPCLRPSGRWQGRCRMSEMSATVVSLPHASHVPGQSHRRAMLRKRKEREILLAIIEEHQRRIAHSSQRSGELLAKQLALDGYRDVDWGDQP